MPLAALTFEHVGGVIAGAAVVGGTAGYVAGAILEQFPPLRGRGLPRKLERQGARWGAYAGCIYYLYDWAGLT